MNSLKQYQSKRKFNKTSEPKGKIKETGLNRFVVQKHQATHLHYDFRLEMDGVLKSWAAPKGLPEKIGIKRLAIQVEPHPVDYINFEGVIPEGHYGAGRVEVWDKGVYNLIDRKKDKIIIKLQGKKLKGKYNLILMQGKNWLIFKSV